MNKYAEFIRRKLTDRELYEQLAEECAELGKASLKCIRAGKCSNNPTTISFDEADNNLAEEELDVIAVLYLIRGDEYFWIDSYWKFERWAKRLGFEE